MAGCMNEQTRHEERPHTKGHNSEDEPGLQGMYNIRSGEHNGNFHHIEEQSEREGRDKNNHKDLWMPDEVL
eukprot:1993004-Heterocapsa_arctica.AAC.1